MLESMQRHPLVYFFLLAFALSWTYWGVIWWPLHLSVFLFPLGGFGPTVAAFLITAIISGRPGVLHLLRACVRWRVGVQWWLVTLVGVPALMLLCFLVMPGALAVLNVPPASFLVFYLTLFIVDFRGGPLGEEPGWRGFGLPRLQERFGPLTGTIILGVLWAFWHLPLWLTPGYAGPGSTFVSVSISFVEFLIGLTAASILMTWVFNNSRGSVLMAILFHDSIDTAGVAFYSLFPPAVLTPYYVPFAWQTTGLALVFGVAALITIVATRGQLSYQRYQREVVLPLSQKAA